MNDMTDREHQLVVNLVRVGLPLHVADQAIAEIEDSLWLAVKMREHEAAVREQVAREIEAAAAAADRSEVERPVVGPMRTDFANDWQWAARIARGQS